jgi:hypothetical protein
MCIDPFSKFNEPRERRVLPLHQDLAMTNFSREKQSIYVAGSSSTIIRYGNPTIWVK